MSNFVNCGFFSETLNCQGLSILSIFYETVPDQGSQFKKNRVGSTSGVKFLLPLFNVSHGG